MTRPHPITSNDEFLALILDELEGQGEVLRQIRDRLPGHGGLGQPEPASAVEPVQVREPAPAVPPAVEGDAGSRNDGGDGAVQVTEPAPPPSRPAKKAAPKKATKSASKR